MEGKRWDLEPWETRHHIMSTSRFLMKKDMIMAEREVEMLHGVDLELYYVMLDLVQ